MFVELLHVFTFIAVRQCWLRQLVAGGHCWLCSVRTLARRSVLRVSWLVAVGARAYRPMLAPLEVDFEPLLKRPELVHIGSQYCYVTGVRANAGMRLNLYLF